MSGRLSEGLDLGLTKEKPDRHPQNQEKASKRQINGSESKNQQGEIVICEGLPVRFGSITEDEPYLPCVNPMNGRVEYLKRENGRNVQHICDIEVFKRSFPGWYRKIQEQMLALCDTVKSHPWPLLTCLGVAESNVGDFGISITANLTELDFQNRPTFSTPSPDIIGGELPTYNGSMPSNLSVVATEATPGD